MHDDDRVRHRTTLLRASGYPLTYARNITDIDDKIIRRVGPRIRRCTDRAFIRYMTRTSPRSGAEARLEPRATDHVAEMLEMIGSWRSAASPIGRKAATEFLSPEVSGLRQALGKIARGSARWERVEVDATKRDPLDFVLWKRAKEASLSGSRPGARRSRLAHRVLRNEHQIAGAHFDITAGRLAVPPSRERNRPVRGCPDRNDTQPFVQILDAQRLCSLRTRNVEIDGNFAIIRELFKRPRSGVVRSSSCVRIPESSQHASSI